MCAANSAEGVDVLLTELADKRIVVDENAMTAKIDAGIILHDALDYLASYGKGYTLGNFPWCGLTCQRRRWLRWRRALIVQCVHAPAGLRFRRWVARLQQARTARRCRTAACPAMTSSSRWMLCWPTVRYVCAFLCLWSQRGVAVNAHPHAQARWCR
jgi:hypothetical protein